MSQSESNPELLITWKHLVSTEARNLNDNTNPHSRRATNLSMKLTGKDNFLDYTFLSHRNAILSQPKKPKLKDYLFDLHETLDLNMDLLEQSLASRKVKAEREELQKLLNQLQLRLKDKAQKRKVFHQKESQSLIEKQIIQQLKRKLDENNTYYREQIKDGEENLDSKEEYIKIFEKKLQEVEIFIQKNTKALTNSPYVKYKGWKINQFLETNNHFTQQRDSLGKDIAKIINSVNEMKKENSAFNGEGSKEVGNSNVLNDNNNKVNIYADYYQKHIKVMQMRIKLLKNSFDSMSNAMSFLKFDKEKMTRRLKEESQDLNKTANFRNGHEDNEVKVNNGNRNEAKETQNKSFLPLDMTRKINNMMDFSIVLNKRADETKYDELGRTGTGGGLGNVTNLNLWDISCINKN